MARQRRLLILGILVVLALGYLASPYVAVARLAGDLAAKRADAALTRIDVPAVRQSIARQVARAFLAKHPEFARKAPLGAQGAGVIVAGAVNAYLAEIFMPANLAALLAEGRLPAQANGAAAALPSLASLREPMALLRLAGFVGPARFAVVVPNQEEGPVGFLFRFHGDGWRLAAIDLPGPWMERLVADIGSRMPASE